MLYKTKNMVAGRNHSKTALVYFRYIFLYIYIYEITQTQKIKCMDFFFIKYLFIAQQILS